MTKSEKRMWLTNIENAADAVATDYGSEVVKSVFQRYDAHGTYDLTADCLIIADETLRICDYKNGIGCLVSAEKNPQLSCYALGALELFDDIYDIDTISMTIYQPRRQNVSTYEVSKDDLYQWADEVLKPTADLAFAGDGNFLCGEWCGFCKASAEPPCSDEIISKHK